MTQLKTTYDEKDFLFYLTFTSKVGQALALALNGWILALFAYKPQEFSKLANIGIKLVCGRFLSGMLLVF